MSSTVLARDEESHVHDILADLVGGVDRADHIGDLMIDQSMLPMAGGVTKKVVSNLIGC